VRSLIAALLLSLVALAPLAQSASAENVSITPSSGSQDQTFTVSGDGLPAGLALDINFKSPGGTVFSTAAMNKVVVVGGDGSFSFDVNPATDFSGESAGSWLVQVCVTGTDNCVQTDFSISV
jgi:hypothetical protein